MTSRKPQERCGAPGCNKVLHRQNAVGVCLQHMHAPGVCRCSYCTTNKVTARAPSRRASINRPATASILLRIHGCDIQIAGEDLDEIERIAEEMAHYCAGPPARLAPGPGGPDWPAKGERVDVMRSYGR